MSEETRPEEEKSAGGGRYRRGGYRETLSKSPEIGKEKEAERDEPIPLDANLMDGESLGPQDPTIFPNADSESGGPVVNEGGHNVPEIGKPTSPHVSGDTEQDLETLEAKVASDPELVPEANDPKEKDETPEQTGEPEVDESDEEVEASDEAPAPEPEMLPDADIEKALEEEPEGSEMQAQGEGITKTQLNEEEGQSSEVAVSDPSDSEEDDIEITAVGEGEEKKEKETF